MFRRANRVRSVAMVNGVQVLSDKAGGISVINGSIVFADGSFCDAATGEVRNAGPGRIELRSNAGTFVASSDGAGRLGPPATTEHRATAVRISGVRGGLQIKPLPHSKSVCTVTAPQDCGVRTQLAGEELNVTGGWGVVVHVPVGTPVSLAADSDTRVGDIHGPLTVSARGSVDIDAGAVSTFSGTVTGSSDLRVAAIEGGDCTIQISGSGDVTVGSSSSTIRHLAAQVAGSGDIVVHGSADSAALGTAGSGSVTVDRVVGQALERSAGSGRISIRNRGPASPPPLPLRQPPAAPPGRRATADDARQALAELLEEWGKYRLDPEAWYLTKPLLHDVTGTVATTVAYNRALQALIDAVENLHGHSPQSAIDEAAAIADRAWETWHAANDYAARVGLGDRDPSERRALQRLNTLVERLAHSTPADLDLAMIKREIQTCLDKITTVSVSWAEITDIPAIGGGSALYRLAATTRETNQGAQQQ